MIAFGHIELDVAIEFDYQPPEPMTHDYPGCDAEIDITSVTFKKIELIDSLSDQEIDGLKTFCEDAVKAANEDEE